MILHFVKTSSERNNTTNGLLHDLSSTPSRFVSTIRIGWSISLYVNYSVWSGIFKHNNDNKYVLDLLVRSVFRCVSQLTIANNSLMCLMQHLQIIYDLMWHLLYIYVNRLSNESGLFYFWRYHYGD